MIRLNKTSAGTQSNTIKLSLNSKRIVDNGVTSYFFIKVVNDMTKDEDDICQLGKLHFATSLQSEVTYTEYTPQPANNENILNTNSVYIKI
mgnify:CR=1 FL=1